MRLSGCHRACCIWLGLWKSPVVLSTLHLVSMVVADGWLKWKCGRKCHQCAPDRTPCLSRMTVSDGHCYVNCCVIGLFLGRHSTRVFLFQIGSSPQSKICIPPKSNLTNQGFLLGFLTEAEMTQNSCITEAHSSMGDSSQSWDLARSMQATGSSTGWRVSLLSDWSKPVPDAPLIPTASRNLVCSQSPLCSSQRGTRLLLFTLAERGPGNLVSFRDYLKF